TGNSMALARYNAVSGSLDTSFGDHGVATATGVSVSIYRIDAAIEPDGRIVVAGTIDHSVGFATARFLAAGPQIGSFTANPNLATAGSSLTLTASNITDTNPNSTVTQVAFFYYDGTGAKVTLGTITVSSGGAWTLTSANAFGLTAGPYTIYAQA